MIWCRPSCSSCRYSYSWYLGGVVLGLVSQAGVGPSGFGRSVCFTGRAAVLWCWDRGTLAEWGPMPVVWWVVSCILPPCWYWCCWANSAVLMCLAASLQSWRIPADLGELSLFVAARIAGVVGLFGTECFGCFGGT